MRSFDAARARLRPLFAGRAAESRMNDEFRFHIEMETDRLMRAKGLAPDEARCRALAAFGGVEKHKEALRDRCHLSERADIPFKVVASASAKGVTCSFVCLVLPG